MDATEKHYLQLLSRSYPTAAKASAEIMRLNALLNLPKGTDFYASDIHGEFEAFSHILRNASGSIRPKIDDVFGESLTEQERRTLATLIYYPQEKMRIELEKADDQRLWYETTLMRLIEVCKRAARKHTRAKLRSRIPHDYQRVVEELMTEDQYGVDKQAYYKAIIDAAIECGSAGELVEVFCNAIQRLSIGYLHIVGDIYDRGPAPHLIMETLMDHHNVDIQWGNHDIAWMGASQGQRGCIAHVVRQCARYGNLSILEDAYGINMLPLASFALEAYKDDPCVAFGLKGDPQLTPQERDMMVKIQKAMTIIMFKVEGQLIDENPSFGLEDRKLLDKVDYQKGTVVVDGMEYELVDKVFPTVDPANPYQLTPQEEAVMQRLEQAFINCDKLQRHMKFFLECGNLYKVNNDCLMFHACVPLNDDGSLKEVDVFGHKLKGKALCDALSQHVRDGFYSTNPTERKRGQDLMWWLWLGEGSPLFAKSKMATFERYLIAEKAAGKEVKNSFYKLLNDPAVVDGIFEDFDMDPSKSHIICGHVPVKVKDGEDPVKCNGKVFCIDGGFSKAYQPTTGIAGYTLINNSYGFILAAHEPLESAQAAIEKELDIHSSRAVVEKVDRRSTVADTDMGQAFKKEIAQLTKLLDAYKTGIIPERRN